MNTENQKTNKYRHLLNEKVIVINGEAGTGKTWLIMALRKEVKILPTATTWAAASLTSGITYYRADRLKANFLNKDIVPHPKSHKVCIIDEASMLSQEKLDWLLKTYPNRKWILVGDWNQLPPTDGTTINISQYPIIELTEQRRSADAGIGQLTQAIKDGNSLAASKIIKNCIMPTSIEDDFYPNVIHIQHTNKTRDKNAKRNFKKGATLIAIRKLYIYGYDEYYHRETSYDEDGEKEEAAKDKYGKYVCINPKGKWWFNNEFLTIIEHNMYKHSN